MPLNKQNVPIAFTGGLNTKTDRKQVVPGNFLSLENAIFTTPGKIRKRNGYQVLSSIIDTGSTIKQGLALATFQEELLEFNGTSLFSYASSTQEWTNKGLITSLELITDSIIRNTYIQTAPDSAQHANGLQVYAWEDSRNGVRYSVRDSITGQDIIQDEIVSANGIKPKCLTIGAYLLILYIDNVTNHLRYLAIPANNPMTVGSPVDITININTTNKNYDAEVIGARVFVAYNNSDLGGGIGLRFINSFLTISAEKDVVGENADGCLSIIGSSTLNQVWVTYYNATDLKYFIYDYGLTTQVLAPTTIETIANVVRIGSILPVNDVSKIWYEISAMATYNHFIKKVTADSLGTVGTPAVFIRSLSLAAKPFFYNGIYYIVANFDSLTQPTYFVLSENGNVVAKAITDNSGGILTENILPESFSPQTGKILFAALTKDLLTTIGGTIFTGTGVSEVIIDFLTINKFYSAELGVNLHITGGLLYMYDGVNVVEHNFNIYPENITFTQSNAGGNIGNASVNTQYQYSITYEWTDNQGQIHRSNPSIPIQVSFASGVVTGSVTLTIPTLRVTSKSGVRIVVYRTEGNGTVFYQVTSVTMPLLNNPAVDTVTYVDTTADSVIIGNPTLYTNGGVVPNLPTPAVSLITTYKNRLIVIPSENKLSFWYSKTIVQNEPVEFSDVFVQDIDQRGGNITAIEQLDDKLILFKENNIFYIIGNGPDSTGANNDFSDAQLITSDGGCTNANSVTNIPTGLVYKSAKGIYLLGRNLSVEYIGAPVEAFNDAVITSSQLVPSTNQVRFTLDSGITLVYDYFVHQWAVFTNQFANDSVVFQDLFTYVRQNGQVFQEAPNTFTDNGEFIKLRMVTSWLSMAGLQGFQRAYRGLFIGEYASPHMLLIQTAYDFNPTLVQQDYIDSVPLFGLTTYGQDSPYGEGTPYGGNYPYYEFRIDFQRQTCTSIQFSIEDVQESNFGEGYSLSAVNFMVGVKQGSDKLPSSRIFG